MVSIGEELGYLIAALKKKILLILGVVFAGFFVSFQFLDPVLLKIQQDLLPEGATLIYISPVEVIMLKVKLALLIGVVLAAPVAGHYAYKSLKMRLRIRNSMKKSHTIILLLSAISLFILGVSYSYFLMLPLILTYLYYMSSSAGVVATYSIYEFISFVSVITLILGISFELPIVLVFAVHSGLVRINTLREYRRYVIVAIFIIAAVFTPPDVVSQLTVAIPLVTFYELSILIASAFTASHSIPLRTQED